MANAGAVSKVGVIKPTTRSKSLGDLQALLPADITLIAENMEFEERSYEEFAGSMAIYGEKVAALAAKGVDMIHPEGAPPFMLKGLAGEARLIAEWEKKYRVPVFTTGTTQTAAMKALGIRRFVGYTPFAGDLANAFHRYFVDAGFEPLSMENMENIVGEKDDLYKLSGSEILDRLVADFKKIPGKPQALYILGSGWRALDAIDAIETALDVPVLHPVVVRCWYILRMLGRSTPIPGKGRLLAEMPKLPA